MCDDIAIMARMARAVIPGVAHHVTQRGVRSIDIFASDNDKDAYINLLKEQGNQYGLRYIGYCLMTNHIHLVVIPKEENSLAQGIGEAHRRYTRMINFREKVRGHLFQYRFFSCALDDNHCVAALRYIERNPVRAGLARRAWEFAYSSAAYHVGKKRKDRLVADHELVQRGDCWKELVSMEPDELSYMRGRFKTGRPCGDKRFISRCEKALGRCLRPMKPGPKADKDVV
jgi:putative transposase